VQRTRRSRGEGTIYVRPDGLWVAQITLPSGKRKTKYGKNQQTVRSWLLEARKAAKDGFMTDVGNITFVELIERYYADVAIHTLKPKTLESYETLIRIHIKPELGNIKLNQLTPVHLQTLYSEKIKAGYSKRTVQYIHSIIRRILSQGVKWGMTTRNIADATDAPKNSPKPPEMLTEDQVKKLLASAKGRLKTILSLAVLTGMRRSELLGLYWEDVDLKNGAVHVKHTAQSLRGRGVYIGEPKTEKSKRTITLPQSIVQTLAEQDPKVGLVFHTSSGKPIAPRNLLRDLQNLLEKCGLPKVTFHSLRHFHASTLLKINIHPKIVQERLGHSRIDTTLDLYTHLVPGMQKEAADKIDELLR
jgi:integrase